MTKLFNTFRHKTGTGQIPEQGTASQPSTASAIRSATAVALAAQPRMLPQQPSGPVAQRSATKTNPLLAKLKSVQPGMDMSRIRQGKLFALIDSIGADLAGQSSIDGLKRIIPAASISRDESCDNPCTDFYTSPPFSLPDGYTVDHLQARVAKSDGGVMMLTLSLQNATVSIGSLAHQYGKLDCALPRGDAPQEPVFHRKEQSWGELRFGYDPHRPDLLKVVVLDKAVA